MPGLQATRTFPPTSTFAAAATSLVAEIRAFAAAMLNPGPFIEQGEQIRALQIEACHLEAADPAGAAVLRRRIAHIGMR